MIKFVPSIIILGLVAQVLSQVKNNYRLPTTTHPIEYTILLRTPLDSDDFSGEVEIKIAVDTPTSEIVINQNGLDVTSAELCEDDDEEQCDPIDLDEEGTKQENYLHLQLPSKELKEGKEYVLKIQYTGHYQNTGIGIFKSKFTNENGDIVPMIATNFVPQYAQYVFPCYDEPQFKTPFKISIEHPVDYHALSNMLGTKSSEESGLTTTTTFHPTPLLSTHSIAFAVSSYKSFCNQAELKICLHYDSLHTEDDVQLVLETLESAIIELDKYLGVELGLSKLDVISVTDVSNEIMGNYGLLITEDSLYYYNPETSSLEQKYLIIRHTIRQLINIYFLNIITPVWWTDIWIHSGITIIFEHIIADMLYPVNDAIGQFIDSLYQFGFIQKQLKPDAGDLSHQDIINLVDGDHQYKSAGIMHMFKGIVGGERFAEGLKKLLVDKTKMYSSETFFNIFQEDAVLDDFIPDTYVLNTIMNSWITEISYPIFEASKHNATVLNLTQRDVLSIYSDSHRTTPWYLPYNSITQNDDSAQWEHTAPIHWLEKMLENQPIDEKETDKWFIYNKQLFGFYHTNYDTDNWNMIAAQLDEEHTKFPMITRTQLMHDAIFFALNSQLKLDIMFKIANYCNKELDYAPLNRFVSQFLELDSKIFGCDVYSNFTKYTLHKISHRYDTSRLTNQLNSALNAKLRQQIIEIACHMGHQNCLEDANKLLVAAVDEEDGFTKLLDSDLGYIILNYGLVSADEELFWKIIKLYNGGHQKDLSEAIGYVQNPELIDQLLTILTTKNGDIVNMVQIILEPKDRSNAIGSLAQQNSLALDKTLSMMMAKSDNLKELLVDIDMVIAVITKKITTDKRLEIFEELLSLYEIEESQIYLDVARAQVEWANKKIPEFQTTLANILENQHNDDDDGAATLTISTLSMVSLLFVSHLYAIN